VVQFSTLAGVFTGIIQQSVPLLDVRSVPIGMRLTIANNMPGVKHGDSIAINGVCLTVAQLDASQLHFDAIPETLDKTNLGAHRAGDLVHIERAMQIGDRFDGHFVQGHVDGTAEVVKQTDDPSDWRLAAKVPEGLAKYLVPKGSITIDGVSMTLAKVSGPFFEVAIIPTTLQITQLGKRPVGWKLNVECDVLSKTIVSFLERRESAGQTGERFW
jgi:riboflavin synthase